MAYDAESDRIVLFGGLSGLGGTPTVFADTWAYDANAGEWTELTPVSGPPGRTTHAMAYDADSDRIVLFGGVGVSEGSFSELGDTWAYDWNDNTWTDMNPAPAPSPRLGHRMAYDAESDLIILLGGHVGSGPSASFLRDLWVYDLDANTWEDVTPSPLPTAANHNGLVYDNRSNRIVAFGGESASGLHDETWVYATPAGAWTRADPSAKPTPRYLHAMAYDEEADLIVVFGGTGGSVGGCETWAYDLEGDAWLDITAADSPSGRILHRMVYDGESDLIVLFGGLMSLSGGPNGETWTLDLGTVPSAPIEGCVGGALPTDPIFISAIVGIAASATLVAIWLWRRRRRRSSPPEH